ncbi:MAG TPA: FAD:protein FMN transferase [Bradyrhizobium sp.]|uniref:FAD:protein FMN transferase n=1 Tax=Bradyrhizobium sp. TaxID=376 RepID=UPI002B6DF0A7|nr:FAD:protein FMN transferase [Bradyrhizobium sp.]HLZ03561.1 FAD:protein FMN transferase [Bradyrhizobium sp.]
MATASADIRRARPMLGTFVEIEVAAASRSMTAIDAAFEAVAEVHRLMSFHASDSDVSRLNREAWLLPTVVHPWTFRVLETAVEMHRRSNGSFDIAVAPALQTMGLLPTVSGNSAIVRGARLPDAIELLPGYAVRFRRADIAIDLGGIAKGFAVDRALEVLRGFGVECGLVNAGGDLAAFGAEPQAIHIRHPRNPGEVVCRVEICNEALASTARRFDPFDTAETASSAVIDPLTDQPPRLIDGTTVRAPSCMIADALTKVVMISGADAGGLLERYEAGALMISRDGDLHITSNLHHVINLAA